MLSYSGFFFYFMGLLFVGKLATHKWEWQNTHIEFKKTNKGYIYIAYDELNLLKW
jgi:hypothetical protein